MADRDTIQMVHVIAREYKMIKYSKLYPSVFSNIISKIIYKISNEYENIIICT